MFNNSTQKEKKPNKKFLEKEKKLKEILSTQIIPSLNLNFFDDTHHSSSPTTPLTTPNTANSSTTSLSTDSSLSSIETSSKADDPKSLGMVRTQPLSDFQSIDIQKEPEQQDSMFVQPFRK